MTRGAQNMQRAQAVSGYQIARQSIALTLSVLLIPFASGNLLAQDGYAPLDALGLDQLVAPIALYPDSLVAQILTAATYPQQVADANNWSRQAGGLPPEQRADEANGMPWDPSVKALTAFPSVLDNMARNYNWMQSLGNAYYNQPGDVMNAIQAARVQAQQAGYLRSTPQQRVYYSDGQILIAPVNPEIVYVPYYDPWRVYGGWVSPYRGYYLAPRPSGLAIGIGLGFAAGISIGLFSHYGWGYHHWEPNWRGGVVAYNHNTYISRSDTVYNRGHFGGYNRGVFEHEGRGVPQNFHPGVTRDTAKFGRGPDVNRPGGGFTRSQSDRPAGVRPSGDRPSGFRPEAARPQAARPQVERSQAPRYQERPQVDRAQSPRYQERSQPQNRPRQESRPQPRAEGAGNRPQFHCGAARPPSASGTPSRKGTPNPAQRRPRTPLHKVTGTSTVTTTASTAITRRHDFLVSNSSSSGVFGQSSRNSRESARSANSLPLVWQCGQ